MGSSPSRPAQRDTRDGASLGYAFVLVGCSRSKRSPILPKVLSLEGREWHVLNVGESPANRYRQDIFSRESCIGKCFSFRRGENNPKPKT